MQRHALLMGLLFGAVAFLAAFGALYLLQAPVEAFNGAGEGRYILVSGYDPQSGSSPCWVIDTDNKKLAVYESQNERAIRLASVRNFTYDMQAHDFTNPRSTGPPVRDMKREAEKAAKGDEDDD